MALMLRFLITRVILVYVNILPFIKINLKKFTFKGVLTNCFDFIWFFYFFWSDWVHTNNSEMYLAPRKCGALCNINNFSQFSFLSVHCTNRKPEQWHKGWRDPTFHRNAIIKVVWNLQIVLFLFIDIVRDAVVFRNLLKYIFKTINHDVMNKVQTWLKIFWLQFVLVRHFNTKHDQRIQAGTYSF